MKYGTVKGSRGGRFALPWPKVDRSPLSNFPGSDFPVATLFMSPASKLAAGQTAPMANLEQLRLERGLQVRTTPQLQDGP